jgi:uncharacterized protein (TIGR01244 family)
MGGIDVMGLIGRLLTLVVGVLLFGCQSYIIGDPDPLTMPPQEIEDWEGVPRLSGIGNVLFAGQPTEEGFRLLAKRGVNVVINLRPDAEMERTMEFDEPTLVESLGMEYVHIPMTPSTFSADDVARLKAVIHRRGTAWGEPFTLVIHCRSSNRCGGLWAAFLHESYRFKESKAIEYGKSAGLRSESMIEATKRVMDD